ncbi:MAG: hypothetical protein LIO87_05510 [Eubacterium sp.]|nr:hypothetical protein [Eubacterium sp.]
MIYLSTALFCEAKPFIELLGLKEDFSFGRVRVFKNENYILTVTGAGVLTSASALGFVLGKKEPRKGDIFLNAGICGGDEKGVYICNKISFPAVEKEYFPDLVYNLGLPERELITCLKPERNIPEGKLCDMEGAAVFECVRGHFSSERCFFIKIVSDKGDFEVLNQNKIYRLVKEYAEDIIERIKTVPPVETGFELEGEILKEAEKLRLSVSQTVILKELLGFFKLKGGDSLELLKSLPRVKTKAEGRDVLEKIKRRVL